MVIRHPMYQNFLYLHISKIKVYILPVSGNVSTYPAKYLPQYIYQ